jgi:hypothetical protein
MKKTLLLLTMSMLLFWSCGSNQSTKENENNEAVSSEKESVSDDKTKDANTCDEFLDQYEAWADDYIKFLEKYKKNPMDPKTMEKSLELSQKAGEWMMNWMNNPGMCSSEEKYEKRFDAISNKIDKKMEELGFE